MAVTAALVKELREKSGAGMLDCKKALEATDGNMEDAVDWLRKKGLASAAKKADRVAAEGLVGAAVQGQKGSLVEVNSETDFVAKNDKFIGFVKKLSQISLAHSQLDDLLKADIEGSNVQDYLNNLIATIGENMNVRRIGVLEEPEGLVVSYTHNAVSDNVGKICVLVSVKGQEESKLEDFGRKVAMHIAASSPLSLDQESLDPAIIEHEKKVQIEIARNSGKPENIIEKMIEGRIRKYYEEVCLLDQDYVLEPDLKVRDAAQKEAIEITGFVRFVLGEGIEKKEENFADEVAKVMQ